MLLQTKFLDTHGSVQRTLDIGVRMLLIRRCLQRTMWLTVNADEVEVSLAPSKWWYCQ